MTYSVKTEDLTKKYGDFTAVDHLNLNIKQGELYALLGVNGAGKTTTIKMLSTLLPPTDGKAFLNGHEITLEQAKVKEITNVSPQETAIAPNLTVRENLELIGGIYGEDKKTANEKATEMINTFSLNSVEGKRSKTLSGGYQRRLSIAMALITNPEILFLDEPTLGLDVLARRELWNAIEKLKGKKTIILTTHYMEEAQALSDRIGIMVGGKLIAEGSAEELMAQAKADDIEQAFITIAEGGMK